MNLAWRQHIVRGVFLAAGAAGVGILAVRLLGFTGWDALADTFFLEGAVLLVLSGLVDVSKSLTADHIRAVAKMLVS